MNHPAGHQGHMWLIGGGAVVALLLGWGLGWVLALAVLACGAMLGGIFWIGRTTAQAQNQNSEHRRDTPHR